MDKQYQQSIETKKWLHGIAGLCLLICFFLPWVLWNEAPVKGYDLPAGNFFSISSAEAGLENPFPQLSFGFLVFWLIPVLIILSVIFAFRHKKIMLPAFIAGALSLALVTVFYLFSTTLTDLGVGRNAFRMLQWPAYVTFAAAIGFILTVIPGAAVGKKLFWVILGPVLAFSAYKFGEKKVWDETHPSTGNVTADYTLSADELLKEFEKNDSTANAKYTEKIIAVNGTVSQVERTSDSATILRFDDPTGSYIAFSFDKDQYEKVKTLKPGDAVSVKGSCSGSFYSEILGTTTINFKRSTLNTNKN